MYSLKQFMVVNGAAPGQGNCLAAAAAAGVLERAGDGRR